MTMYDPYNYADVAWYNAMAGSANDAATQEYNRRVLSGQADTRALDAAKFAWQQQLDAAGQTGMWNGAYNMPSQQWFTGQFGTWMPGGPQAGQQTLTAQQQAFNQAYQNSGMYGQYFAPGTNPYQGQQTQAAINQAQQLAMQQANLTGYYQAPVQQVNPSSFGAQDQATQQQYLQYNGNDPVAAANKWAQDANSAVQRAYNAAGGPGQGTQTLAGQQQQWSQGFQQQQFEAQQRQLQQQNAQQYLQLLSSLRGPADWAKYQQVLGATPGGMRDLVAAAAGQYTPGGGATTGVNPQAANLNTLVGQVAGQGWSGTPGEVGAAGQSWQSTPYGQQNNQVWGSGIGVGAQQPTGNQQMQATGNGTNLPAPNQISARSWNNMAPSQQEMLKGMYEAQGWDKNDVQALYNQSLPKYATNSATAGTWRLQ